MGHCHHLSNPNHFPTSVSTPIGGFQIGLQLERDKLEPSVNAASFYALHHAMEENLRGDLLCLLSHRVQDRPVALSLNTGTRALNQLATIICSPEVKHT